MKVTAAIYLMIFLSLTAIIFPIVKGEPL